MNADDERKQNESYWNGYADGRRAGMTESEERMTTPTPRTDSIKLTERGAAGLLQDYCDLARQLERDLAAREAELRAIADHVGGGAFYRDENGGRLPLPDQVGQHIAELNQQLAARDAELALWREKDQHWCDWRDWVERAGTAEEALAAKGAELAGAYALLHQTEDRLAGYKREDAIKASVNATLLQRAEAAEQELAAIKAENSKLRSALEIVHFKREPWQ